MLWAQLTLEMCVAAQIANNSLKALILELKVIQHDSRSSMLVGYPRKVRQVCLYIGYDRSHASGNITIS